MKLNFTSRNSALCLRILAGMLVGFCIPISFIFLDLKQLGLTFDLINMYEIFKSQNIYIFSLILFPALFGVISALYFYTYSQNKKLAEQEYRIKNILNSLIDSILVCDSTGKIKYSNLAYERIYANKTLEELLDIRNINQAVMGQFLEMSLVSHEGKKHSVNYIIYKLNDEVLSEDDHFIVSIRDIEDLKKNEKIIESQKEQLFEVSKLSALGEMASGFAHEINNPLTIINGKLLITERGIQKGTISNETILDNIDVCKKTIGRINKIINGLRNLAHGSENLKVESITVKNIIEDSLEIAILKMSGKGIDLQVDFKAVEDQVITCNRIQISQVLMNLLGNAIDAIEGHEAPWLKLKAELNENLDIKISITDSGKGIPLEVQKRMFEPMFSTKAIGKGTGLGLSVSRSIIENHKGKILINNDSVHTCFEIILPRENISAKAA